jgi:hypothetical protein
MDESGLTKRYKALQQLDDAGEAPASEPSEMDKLYLQIVVGPIANLHDAIEKLDFAHYCLTEEDDFKEAANLIHKVSAALTEMAQRRIQLRSKPRKGA